MSFMNARSVMLMTLTALMTFPGTDYGTVLHLRTGIVLTLTRKPLKEGVFIGRLLRDGQFECYTLEDAHFAIPPGTYNVTLHYSEKAARWVPLIHVPGRTWIEIHPGNFQEDSKGCILVGISHTDKSVVGSSKAFIHLMKHLSLPCSLVVS